MRIRVVRGFDSLDIAHGLDSLLDAFTEEFLGLERFELASDAERRKVLSALAAEIAQRKAEIRESARFTVLMMPEAIQ